jgi:formate dehydrogenase major subunit
MARRDNADPYDSGLAPGWAWAWPVNRRILYDRASCDADGKPWNPRRKVIKWNGKSRVGADVPDYPPAMKPAAGMDPFIMTSEGCRSPLHARLDEGRPVPGALRAVRIADR